MCLSSPDIGEENPFTFSSQSPRYSPQSSSDDDVDEGSFHVSAAAFAPSIRKRLVDDCASTTTSSSGYVTPNTPIGSNVDILDIPPQDEDLTLVTEILTNQQEACNYGEIEEEYIDVVTVSEPDNQHRPTPAPPALSINIDASTSHVPLVLSSPEEEIQAPSFSTTHLASDEGETSMLPTTIDSDDVDIGKRSIDPDFNSFWQYKKFPKGPKPRLTFEIDASEPEKNPHEPIAFNDPVFNKSQKNSVRHFGKARIGEGNDITPDPAKLAQLGFEIETVTEKMVALGDSVKVRREKVRLSSRLCRLKRSANHEANKIKLDGLEKEREELSSVITAMNRRLNASSSSGESLVQRLDFLKQARLSTDVAGRTGDYVNSILESHGDYGSFSDSDSDD